MAVTQHPPRARGRSSTGSLLHEPPIVDRTWERAAILNQLLLGSVVFVVGLVIVVEGSAPNPPMFFGGVVAVFSLTGATLIIPWNRLRYGWVAVIPALDIIAIALMRVAMPDSAMGLLWVFPALWLAGSFGLIGLAGVVIGVTMLIVFLALTGTTGTRHATILLPLAILAVAATSYLNTRRSQAQRSLLDKQAQLLRGVLEHSRRQEQEVTEVLDAVDFGVIRISAGGRVAVTNEAHARLQMATNGDGGASHVPAFRDDGVTPLPLAELPLERALRGEAFENQVVWFGEEPDARQALSVTARRLTGSGGKNVGAVVVSRDVTNELSALRARDELVASVSHELRTPLTSILGYLDLAIENPETPEKVRANLDIAERNAERLLRIVADILTASSSSSSSIEASIAPRAVDVRELLANAAADMATHAESRALTIDVTGLEEATAWADPLRLRQVVDNLLANAIRYNKYGGTVYLGSTTDGTSTWLLVRDTGPGISDDDRTRLFQRYYKAGAARRTGTGLGLAITRDIVRAHGGELGLHTSVGVGSTFIVKIPAAPMETDA
ncbi:ATP-binding protein [Microbacterium sp. C7(2022)]|uniref:ATP-binding protein n=1 Tax=Microbacterium sp. C7(2022) TaxID=2992759 RepID=UPI00237B4A42|nr:ATP-binding protein [Microbacterium sp. C7(2022)]MDE0546791.1 ATP-binding protein [Microbacterium sp. C7(2022)]